MLAWRVLRHLLCRQMPDSFVSVCVYCRYVSVKIASSLPRKSGGVECDTVCVVLCMRSRDGAVSMAFTTEESLFDFRQGQEICFFPSVQIGSEAHTASLLSGYR